MKLNVFFIKYDALDIRGCHKFLVKKSSYIPLSNIFHLQYIIKKKKDISFFLQFHKSYFKSI